MLPKLVAATTPLIHTQFEQLKEKKLLTSYEYQNKKSAIKKWYNDYSSMLLLLKVLLFSCVSISIGVISSESRSLLLYDSSVCDK